MIFLSFLNCFVPRYVIHKPYLCEKVNRTYMKHKFLSLLLSLFVLFPSYAEKVEEKDYVAYLFTYFTGNHISQEAVFYRVSMDGYTYWALNNNKPVIDSKVISSTGGVRDPHILRCQDGKTF